MKFYFPLFVALFVASNVCAQELTVVPLISPIAHSGSLSSGDYEFDGRFMDVFEVTLSEFSKLEITAESDTFDTVLYVLDLQTDELHYNDDSNGLHAGFKLSVNSGTYWVAVTSTGENSQGSYSLAVERPQPQIYYIVDEDSLASLNSEVAQLIDDVSSDTNTLGTLIEAPEDPADIRNLLRKAWIDDDLVGAFFIGEAPHVSVKFEGSLSNNSTLSDHYFKALDCPYEYDSANSMAIGQVNFSILSRCESTIWLSRIFPSKSGVLGIEQVRSYLNKNHILRRDKSFYKKEMAFQPSTPREDQTDYSEFLAPLLSAHPLYASDAVNIEQNESASIQRSRFEEAMTDNFELLSINVHGSPELIQFQGLALNEFSNMSSASLGSLDINAKIIEYTSCSVGQFTFPDYFAGETLFGHDTLLVSAYTEVILVNFEGLVTAQMDTRYRALGYGMTYADAYRYTTDGNAEHLFGDPTISLRDVTTTGQGPEFEFDGKNYQESFKSNLDMGVVRHDATVSQSVTVMNSGNEELVIDAISGNIVSGGYIAQAIMVNGSNNAVGSAGFIFELDLSTSDAESPFEYQLRIPPGQSSEIVFKFTPSAHASAPFDALYTGQHRFRTNDPKVPLFHVEVTGSHSISSAPSPTLHGTSSDRRLTTSVFGGGASHSNWETLVQSIDVNLPVDVAGIVVPDEKHIGMLGDLYLFVHLDNVGWYALDSNRDAIFLGKGQSLSADSDIAYSKTEILTSSHEVELFSNEILVGTGLSGTSIGIVTGYSIVDEDVLYFNKEPFNIRIQ